MKPTATTAPEEFISDLNPLAAAPTGTDLEREYLRLPFKFKELELHPYTHGADLLFRQLCDPADNGLTRAAKFIFMLVKRGGASMEEDVARHVLPLAWGPTDELHLALLRWSTEHLRSEADTVRLIELHSEIRDAAMRSTVEVVPPAGSGQKKTQASGRRRRRS